MTSGIVVLMLLLVEAALLQIAVAPLTRSIRWGWDWTSFWTQTVAGLISFGGSLLIALLAYRLDRRAERARDKREFRAFAIQVREDAREAISDISAWQAMVLASNRTARFDPIPKLTWDLADLPALRPFAANGIWRTVETAFQWYRTAVRATSQWKVADGAASAAAREEATRVLSGAKAYLEEAITDLNRTLS